MNTEQIKSLIAEQKQKASIINNLTIDWENTKALLNQIANSANTETPEFKEACKLAHSLCEDVKAGLEQVKTILPRD
jgi:hypothetical protein